MLKDSRLYEIFAFDFLIDESLDIWLLEVNQSPQMLDVGNRKPKNLKTIADILDI